MSYLIVGLGNIGKEYADTRHNMGFMILDAWAQASNVVFRSKRFGHVAEIMNVGNKFVLLKPNTYMNLSGHAVAHWVKKLKLPLDRLLVISDDLNLPFGTLRLRKGGSSGGHNGLEDIEDMLDTRDYARLRVGIGNDFKRGEQIDFVLGKLSTEEKALVEDIAKKAIEGIRIFASLGVERAMNVVNTNAK